MMTIAQLTIGWVLVLTVMCSHPTSPTASGWINDSCRQSPAENLLPVVGTMIGASPVWLVDGSATWKEAEPIKTLWVLRRTSEEVRIEGTRLDAVAAVTFQREGDPPVQALVVSNPGFYSVTPSGVPPDITREYVFLPSNVMYPTPGCWQFSVRVGHHTSQIVRDLKPAAP